MNKLIFHTQKAYASRSMGPFVKQVIPGAVSNVDPFVFLDHFGPIEKGPGSGGVPPHPHAGIATITYLFSGSNRHQDSLGNDVTIHAGDVAWMQAGKGIIHAEGMAEHRTETETIHGLQLWISLPAKDKFIDPAFFHYPSTTLPSFEHNGAIIKVLAGSLLGRISPVKSLSPAYIFEVNIPAGTQIEIPITEGDTCGLYMITGNLAIADKQLLQGTISKFDTTGDALTIAASADSHFIILGGTPLQEPIVAYASFVMNSEEQIAQVMDNYRNGKMGTLTI